MHCALARAERCASLISYCSDISSICIIVRNDYIPCDVALLAARSQGRNALLPLQGYAIKAIKRLD